MVKPTRPPANRFNALARRIYNPLGFSKAYNFILFFIFNGALLGFTLARLQYLSFSTIFCPETPPGTATGAVPGECYYYRGGGHHRIGIMLHLGTILPAALLATLQFTPAIRHRAILFHRINGYVVLLLVLLANVGALMIARHAFGGGLDVQGVVGLLAVITTAALVLAYVNIKRLQIEQHRAWMLRAWFYLGSIITSRIIQIITVLIATANRTYFVTRPCAQLPFTLQNSTTALLAQYPSCAAFAAGRNDGANVALVRADMQGSRGGGGAPGVGFGMALWLALALHAAGVEAYLALTPREHERQLEAGMRHPGSAGLTPDRLGDAEPWVPESVKGKRGSEAETLMEAVEER